MRARRYRARFLLALAIGLTSCFGQAPAAIAAETHGPDVGVTVQRSGDDPRPLIASGQSMTLVIGIDNLRGDADAHDATLAVTPAPGLKVAQARPAPSRTEGQKLVWSLGSLSAAAFPQFVELDIVLDGSPAPNTELDVAATVTTADNDPDQANNSVSFPIYAAAASADLAVSTSLDAVSLVVGPPVMFHAEVRNLGTVPASTCILTLALPPKVGLKSADPTPASTRANVVTWQLGDIAPDDGRTIAVSIALDASLAGSAGETLKFAFDAATVSADANPADNHLDMDRGIEQSGSDLKVWLNVEGGDAPGVPSAGADVVYAISYGNFGNAPAKQAAVSLSLGSGLRLASGDPSPTSEGKSEKFSGGTYGWNVGDLGVGQSGVIRSRVHIDSVPSEGSLAIAAISSPTADLDTANNVSYSVRHLLSSAQPQPGPSGLPIGRIVLLAAGVLILGGVAALVLRRRLSR